MILADFSYEQKLWKQGYQFVAGLDEVGRGSWAGPVVAAAVIFPIGFKQTFKLADSKLLKPREREELSSEILKSSISFSISEVGLMVINNEGIGKATQRAFKSAVNQLSKKPDFHLVDAFYIKNLPKKSQLPIIRGDQKSASIAAASIIAKVYRDKLMRKLGREYPQYGFGKHKGYGTKLHQEAIRINGFSEIHRSSFNLEYLISAPDSHKLIGII